MASRTRTVGELEDERDGADGGPATRPDPDGDEAVGPDLPPNDRVRQ
jgi:hypothetical protein